MEQSEATAASGPHLKWNSPGMRRVRLLLWHLFRKTPLKVEIAEWVERGAARRCKMSWEEYGRLKNAHPDLWLRAAQKRERAKREGWAKQPPQLRWARMEEAPRRALFRKQRPRYVEWAGRKLIALRYYKRQWLRERVRERVMLRFLVPRGTYRRVVREAVRRYF